MSTHEARVTIDGQGTYLVEFPGLPGCHTFADTADDVQKMADDALRVWLDDESAIAVLDWTAGP